MVSDDPIERDETCETTPVVPSATVSASAGASSSAALHALAKSSEELADDSLPPQLPDEEPTLHVPATSSPGSAGHSSQPPLSVEEPTLHVSESASPGSAAHSPQTPFSAEEATRHVAAGVPLDPPGDPPQPPLSVDIPTPASSPPQPQPQPQPLESDASQSSQSSSSRGLAGDSPQPPLTVESPTLDPPPPSRARRPGYWVVRIVPVLALLLIIGWATVRISALTAPRRPKDAPPPEVKVIAAGDDSSAEELVEFEDTYDGFEDDIFDGEPAPGESLGALVRYQVERYDPETDTVGKTSLADGPLRYGAVTIVNLWATWCKACKEEFPGFQSLLFAGRRESSWGPEVRFVTLMLADPTFASDAYSKFKDELPPDTVFLADRKFDPVEDTLKEKSLLPESGDLPVTFLLDCRRRVRWHRKGALSAADFDELDKELRALRDELSTPKCKRRKRKRPTKKKKKTTKAPPGDPTKQTKKSSPDGSIRSVCNRNKVCDENENTASCPVDCPPDPFD